VRIAIIGTGIAGNAAAFALSPCAEIAVYEKDLRPGGHSHTIDVDYEGTRLSVDTGFIVYNELNYPDLTALFAHLDVETHPSTMGFSFSLDRGKMEWAGKGVGFWETADGLFAQRKNLLSLPFVHMLTEILRFNRVSREDLEADALGDISLGDYLARRGISSRLIRHYLAPMGAAIWSTPAHDMLGFPAQNFLSFFNNHRLLHPDAERPIWRSVIGGSRRYVEKITQGYRRQMRLGCAVVSVERTPAGVIVTDSSGHRDRFDQVVFGCHSDEALEILADPTEDERAILGAIQYRPNVAYLHRDPALMPKQKRAWSSWNFLSWEPDAHKNDAAITYWMNALQGIDEKYPLFVSLNPPCEPASHLTFARYNCAHPQFDARAFAAQKRLDDIQGVKRTWFCGAWTGYGFHEDGLRSGLDVGEALGAPVPWRPVPASLAQAAE
jgi:predicted NAD/FAD-binding protein